MNASVYGQIIEVIEKMEEQQYIISVDRVENRLLEYELEVDRDFTFEELEEMIWEWER